MTTGLYLHIHIFIFLNLFRLINDVDLHLRNDKRVLHNPVSHSTKTIRYIFSEL